MTGVTYKFDAREVLTALQGLLDRGGNVTPAMRSFGEYLLSSHRDRFAKQVSPDGVPWAPLSPDYKAEKKKNKDKILVLDGHLKGLMRYKATDTSLLFGTDRVYGAIHQFGASKGQFGKTKRGSPIPWGDIKARPFIGVSDADKSEALRIVGNYVMGR